MKTKTKNIIIGILCFLLSGIMYAYLCVVMTPKDINDAGGALYYNGMGFEAEPENSLDILIYGNSDVYSGFVPAVIYSDQGYTSYASGRARQSIPGIYSIIKSTLKNQSPKLIILETDCFFDIKDERSGGLNLILSPFVYHSRWKDLKPRDFYQLPDRKSSVDINKGYIDSKAIYDDLEYIDYMGDKDSSPAEIPDENLKALDDIVQLCEKNDIKLAFTVFPSPVSWNYSKHNAIKEYANKNNIIFWDLNVDPEEFGLDPKKDFRDNGNHLNCSGAYKVTSFLGNEINREFDFIFSKNKKDDLRNEWEQVVNNYNSSHSVI